MDAWSNSVNTQSVVLSDMNTGDGDGTTSGTDVSSFWTTEDSGNWRGVVVRGDQSTSTGSSHVIDQTKYGDGNLQTDDNLFEDTSSEADAIMVTKVNTLVDQNAGR